MRFNYVTIVRVWAIINIIFLIKVIFDIFFMLNHSKGPNHIGYDIIIFIIEISLISITLSKCMNIQPKNTTFSAIIDAFYILFCVAASAVNLIYYVSV
ncbi:hypothetical protein CPA56_02805 [Bombella sp. TMW2.1889]|uniref:MARVEL domain-containing protein n=1 Tax=Bombella mellum TaxID=2039288 RepID=A0ABR5ZRL3_9PROT|nr:hypothetical protein [Bombella mellum]